MFNLWGRNAAAVKERAKPAAKQPKAKSGHEIAVEAVVKSGSILRKEYEKWASENDNSDWMSNFLWCEYFKLIETMLAIVVGVNEDEPRNLSDASEHITRMKTDFETMINNIISFEDMYQNYFLMSEMISTGSSKTANDFRISFFNDLIANYVEKPREQKPVIANVPKQSIPVNTIFTSVNNAKEQRPYRDEKANKFYNRFGVEVGLSDYRKDLAKWVEQKGREAL